MRLKPGILIKNLLFAICCVLIISSEAGAQSPCNITVTTPPAGFNAFYKKYVSVRGIPILSSEKVSDSAFCVAAGIVYKMTQKLTTAQLNSMITKGAKLAIMSENEVTTDIPEHSDLYTAFPGTDWNIYRGLGSTIVRPTTSCAEENLLCYFKDVYKGENILVHEFTHCIQILGLQPTDASFVTTLQGIYNNAISLGLWTNTYAGSNYTEYFAEGVQDWFNTNIQAIPTNGIHNAINTRPELQTYDVDLYNLISQYFENDSWVVTCDATVAVPIGVAEHHIARKMVAYPNPFSSKIMLSNTKPGMKMVLCNAIGQLIWSGSDIATQDLSALQPGIYFLKLSSEDGSETMMLTKE